MSAPRRSNRYLAWNGLCPNTNGPHQNNPCACGAYDRSRPFAMIPRRQANVPKESEVIDLCSDSDDDKRTGPPAAEVNLGPAQYGYTAYISNSSDPLPSGSTNTGQFVSTNPKQPTGSTIQHPKHLKINQTAAPQGTLIPERHAPSAQHQPLQSPKQASSARNVAISKDAAMSRADQRPSVNDPPPAVVNNLPYNPPRPKEAYQRAIVQFWTWDYVQRTGDRKEGKSLQRYGNENVMLIRNIKRKYSVYGGPDGLDTSLRDYLLEHAYSNAEQPLDPLGVTEDLYDKRHMFVWAIKVKEAKPDNVYIVTSLSLAECHDMTSIISLFQGKIHILWPIKSIPATDTDDVAPSSRPSTSFASRRTLTSASSSSSLKREAQSLTPLNRKKSKLNLSIDKKEEINWPDVQVKEESDTDSLPSLDDLIPERKKYLKKPATPQVEMKLATPQAKIKIEPGLYVEVDKETEDDAAEQIKTELKKEKTPEDDQPFDSNPTEGTFEQLFEDLIETDPRPVTPVAPDEVDRLSDRIKVSIAPSISTYSSHIIQTASMSPAATRTTRRAARKDYFALNEGRGKH